MAKEKRSFYGTGRRKGSVAKVTLTPGTGKITVNGRDVHEYMPYEVLVMDYLYHQTSFLVIFLVLLVL